MTDEERQRREEARLAYLGELLWLIAAMLNALLMGGDFQVPDWFEVFSRPGEETPRGEGLRQLLEERDE